jgi:hypothetical protein
LKFLARLEADSFTGRNRNLGASAWVSSDTGLPRPDVEDAKASQFDAVTLTEGFLHGFKHRLNGHFRFGFRNPSTIYNLVNDIELDQGASKRTGPIRMSATAAQQSQ